MADSPFEIKDVGVLIDSCSRGVMVKIGGMTKGTADGVVRLLDEIETELAEAQQKKNFGDFEAIEAKLEAIKEIVQ